MSSAKATVLLTGDVMTGRGIDQILENPSDPVLYESWARSAEAYVDLAERRNGPIPRGVDGDYVWGDAGGLLRRPDHEARIINLETAVTVSNLPWPAKGINYRMHPGNAPGLLAGKVDCCVLANNHVLDWSHDGLLETLTTLDACDLSTAGAGAEDRALAAVRVSHRVVIVALGVASSGIPGSWAAAEDRLGVAFARSPGDAQVETVASRIARVAESDDVVVASIHWGPNWGYDLANEHRRLSHALISEAGVDIVHGHSSHHPLEIEVYRDRPILYGCGDLINDYEGIAGHERFHPDLGIVYLVSVEGSGVLVRLELVPFRRHRFRLEMAPADERRWLQQKMASLGTRLEPGDGESLLLRW